MNEKEETQKPAESAPAAAQPPTPPPVDPPPVEQRSAPENDKPREKMSKSDLIMSLATIVIAAGTIVSAVAIVLQWHEMHTGGADTKAIADAAQKQVCAANRSADAAQKFAETAALINGSIGDAVKKLDNQARATQGSANAAKSAAVTADKALHVSERAYIVAGQPTIDTGTKYITLPIVNNGHIPSGKVRAIIHEVTIDGTDPAAVRPTQHPATEAHWKHYEFESVPTTAGQTMSFSISIPTLNAESLISGHEQVLIVGVITYSDGFSDDTEQQWPFCYGSALLSQSKSLIWAVCESSSYLPQAIQADHYPNNEYDQ